MLIVNAQHGYMGTSVAPSNVKMPLYASICEKAAKCEKNQC